MSNRSTNDTSYNTISKEILNNLQYVIARLESEIEEVLIPINTQEIKGLVGEINNYCDIINKIYKDINSFYYSYIEDIYLKFREKNDKDINKYNIMNNYDIKTDSKTNKTYLINKRKKFTKEEICNECYQINSKFKLREDMLLIILVKNEEKDKILILLIKEKKIREDEDEQKDKKKEEEKDEHEENKYFKYIPDSKFHVFYKTYNFRLEIPQFGQNFSSYILYKNGKEEIILCFWSEKKIYLFNIENINDDSDSIKTKYIFKLDFEPIFIIPIKIIIENKEFLLLNKNEINFTEFFLVITKENNLKLFKYVEKARALYICNIKYEYESEDDKNSIAKKYPYHAEQLDNGLIAIHFKDEIDYFYLNSKEQK